MASNSKKSFALRLDPKLYDIIERWAADDLRSVNGHIEFLLRDAASRAGRLPHVRPAQGRSSTSEKKRMPADSEGEDTHIASDEKK